MRDRRFADIKDVERRYAEFVTFERQRVAGGMIISVDSQVFIMQQSRMFHLITIEGPRAMSIWQTSRDQLNDGRRTTRGTG